MMAKHESDGGLAQDTLPIQGRAEVATEQPQRTESLDFTQQLPANASEMAVRAALSAVLQHEYSFNFAKPKCNDLQTLWTITHRKSALQALELMMHHESKFSSTMLPSQGLSQTAVDVFEEMRG